MTNSQAYEQALATVNQAFWIFDAVRSAYRNRKITDAEFCAAFNTYKAAQREFDVALEAEQNR